MFEELQNKFLFFLAALFVKGFLESVLGTKKAGKTQPKQRKHQKISL